MDADVIPLPDPKDESVVPFVPTKPPSLKVVLLLIGAIPLLYLARPVLLPIILACVAAMTLKPVIRWMSYLRLPPALSAAIVLSCIVAAATFGFYKLGHPAVAWINDAPQHMTDLRQRVQKILPPSARFSEAAAAVSNLGATEAEKKAEQKKTPLVQIKNTAGPTSVLNWTETFLVGMGETLVLLYLLLASGDMFLQKLVRVMPTLSNKKSAVDISHEIQQSISNYFFAITLINIGLGVLVSTGLYFTGVPNAALWGILVATFNFVPYFGPVAGVLLLAAVGLLTFETSLWQALLPPAWYLLLHLLESNLITPVLLGRRFTLNPVVIFVSLIFWTALWGIPGALLSVPILVSLKVISDRVPSLAHLSEFLAS
jgi:predicted PurR-regulated permease PerM